MLHRVLLLLLCALVPLSDVCLCRERREVSWVGITVLLPSNVMFSWPVCSCVVLTLWFVGLFLLSRQILEKFHTSHSTNKLKFFSHIFLHFETKWTSGEM